jgi:ABC-type cobalamin/Fe3+-siderophores transport system ATPase subunit
MLGPERELPKDLGRQPPIDPLALEPGMIVWDRFVVVGKVRHAAPVWSVAVSDLRREFGRVPHHRVTLHFLPISERERVSRALAADAQVQPRVYATVGSSKGLALVHEPIEGEALPDRLPAREARALALALAGLLARLHDARIHGLELRATQLRQREGQFRLDGFEHLLATGSGTPEHDVETLLELLRRLAGEQLHALLEPAPQRAFELWTRARELVETYDRVGITLPAAPPFVGRERARRVLRQAFGEAEIARASLVLISGEAGVGKTRLLDELAAELQRDDRALLVRGTYLRGRSESGLRTALAGLVRALPADPEAATPARIRERVLKRTGPLANLLLAYVPAMQALIDPHAELPEIDEGASKSGARALDGGISRRIVTVADAIRSIGSHERPLVILLDEVQLADHGSLAILRRLLHEDRSHHTLIVAALSGEPPSELRDDVREPPLRKLELGPLDVDELEQLIAAGLPGAVAQPRVLAEALHASSRGNPLVAWSLVQAWIERGVLTRQADEGPWLLRQRELPPSSPSEVFARRVDVAGLDEQALALLAAVAGDRVDAAWFARMSGWDAARVASTLAQLERHALLHALTSEEGERGELRFTHEGVRELVLTRASAGELRRAHATIAAGLAAQPDARAALLAYHTDRALGQESKAGIDLAQMHLAAARELLDVHDLDRSIWHFTRARTEPGDHEGRLAAIEGAADVAILAGHCSEAASLYVEAIEQAAQPQLVCRIAAKAVHVLLRKSAAREAEAIGRLALARVDAPLPSGTLRRSFARLVGERRGPLHDEATREQLGWLYARMATLLGLRDPIEAELCIDRGRAVCEGLDSPASAHVLALHAARLAARGQLDAARRGMADAAALAERVESEWARGLVAHLRACTIELPSGAYQAGLASLDAAIAHFRQTGDMSIAAASYLVKAIHGREREPVSRVQGWLDEGAALGESQGDANVDLAIEALRLYLRARSGARNVADAAAGVQARALARPRFHMEGLLTFAFLALALAEVAEPQRAREQLDVLADELTRQGPLPELLGDLELAHGLVGNRKDRSARARIEVATKRLEQAGRHAPRLAAFALHIRMRHAMAENQRERAHELATKLIAGASEHGQLLIVHEAHRTLAELLRSSDVLAAREHQQQAKQITQQLGLDRARERELMDSSSDDHDAPRPRRREQSTRRRSDAYLRAVARSELVDAAALLEGSRKRLLDMLGNASWLYIQAEPELRIFGESHELQSLLVHLALAARDAVPEPAQLRVVATRDQIDERQAVTLPGASPGSWARLAVTVVGVRSGNAGLPGGINAARQFASRLGGFLVQTQDDLNLTLAVYLPAERLRSSAGASESGTRSRIRVLVVHGDPVVRETLGTAITRLGHPCSVVAPGEAITCEFDILFAERDVLTQHGEHEHVKLVEIASRISQTSGTFPLLRVPFVLGELRRHLE